MFFRSHPHPNEITVRHSWMLTVWLHLLPGIPIALAFWSIGWLARDTPGWIALYTLTITAVAVELPLLMVLTRYLIHRERQAGVLVEAEEGLPYRRRQPVWIWVLATALIVCAAVLNMAGTPALTAPFSSMRALAPEWAVLAFEPSVFARAIAASSTFFWLMWLASFPALMLAGGIAQEIYFRGYLLPRMPRAGLVTPVANAVLFSVFHLTSPWSIVARLPYVIIFSLMAWWRKSLNLVIWIHAGMGGLLFAMGTIFLLIGISRATG